VHILILTPEYLPTTGGGIVTFYRHLLPEYVRAGHRVRVIAGSGVSAARQLRASIVEGVEVEALDLNRLKRHLSRFSRYELMPGLRRHLAAAWAMWEQACDGEEFDIIEACDWGLSFIPPILDGTKPTIVQAHGSIGQIDVHDPIEGEEAQSALVRLLEARFIARASAVQSYSFANANFWRVQTDRDVSRMLPAWRPIAASRDGVPKAKALVVGRVQNWKGPHILCEAVSLLGVSAPRVHWVGRDTVSGNRTKSTSATLASRYPNIWGPRICHMPAMPPEQIAALQSHAKINIVPSTWDVFNLTCVEAMASGRPVICSNGAGASELIEDGVTGFIFNSDDAAALAAVLERVCSASDRELDAIGRAGREKILRTLNPEAIAQLRLEAYERVIVDFVARPPSRCDWLSNDCIGRDSASASLAFLDHLPLKSIIAYGGKRLISKIMG
jgi:glycosyltransferase involved in cell wall biosynthesis